MAMSKRCRNTALKLTKTSSMSSYRGIREIKREFSLQNGGWLDIDTYLQDDWYSCISANYLVVC